LHRRCSKERQCREKGKRHLCQFPLELFQIVGI
jgi:hypothetical protein